mgnify:CR=1 FL=1
MESAGASWQSESRQRRKLQESWVQFADAVLQREAVLCRVSDGLAPRDFAGMFVDHADVDRILHQLPGLNGPYRRPTTFDASLHVVVDDARHELHASVCNEPTTRFSQLARSANLGRLRNPDGFGQWFHLLETPELVG